MPSLPRFALAALITIGVLGLPVMDNFLRWPPGKRLSLHSKLTLSITLILTVLAMAAMTVSTLLVAIFTLLMTLLQQGDLFAVTFEVISAFSNTGYSVKLTGDLSLSGKFLIHLARRVSAMFRDAMQTKTSSISPKSNLRLLLSIL